jgi:hypothetical protein
MLQPMLSAILTTFTETIGRFLENQSSWLHLFKKKFLYFESQLQILYSQFSLGFFTQSGMN